MSTLEENITNMLQQKYCKTTTTKKVVVLCRGEMQEVSKMNNAGIKQIWTYKLE